MLPNTHHQQDAKWLEEQLARLPLDVALDVCGKYSAVYRDAYNDEPNEIKKEGIARRVANTRLRIFVKDFSAWRTKPT